MSLWAIVISFPIGTRPINIVPGALCVLTGLNMAALTLLKGLARGMRWERVFLGCRCIH